MMSSKGLVKIDVLQWMLSIFGEFLRFMVSFVILLIIHNEFFAFDLDTGIAILIVLLIWRVVHRLDHPPRYHVFWPKSENHKGDDKKDVQT